MRIHFAKIFMAFLSTGLEGRCSVTWFHMRELHVRCTVFGRDTDIEFMGDAVPAQPSQGLVWKEVVRMALSRHPVLILSLWAAVSDSYIFPQECI